MVFGDARKVLDDIVKSVEWAMRRDPPPGLDV
jgi:hypothetical protein